MLELINLFFNAYQIIYLPLELVEYNALKSRIFKNKSYAIARRMRWFTSGFV